MEATWRAANTGDDPSTACLTAEFRSGNNALTGPWEYCMSGQSGNAIAKQYAWGSSGGQLESGAVQAELDVAAGGGANSVSFTVDSGATIVYGSQTYANILKVGFYVAVDGLQTSETIEWEDITITFYDANNNPLVLDVSADLPKATTGNRTNFWIAVPDSTFTAVRVVVSGDIHLNASVTNPGANALIGYIYVWTSTCMNN